MMERKSSRKDSMERCTNMVKLMSWSMFLSKQGVLLGKQLNLEPESLLQLWCWSQCKNMVDSRTWIAAQYSGVSMFLAWYRGREKRWTSCSTRKKAKYSRCVLKLYFNFNLGMSAEQGRLQHCRVYNAHLRLFLIKLHGISFCKRLIIGTIFTSSRGFPQ